MNGLDNRGTRLIQSADTWTSLAMALGLPQPGAKAFEGTA